MQELRSLLDDQWMSLLQQQKTTRVNFKLDVPIGDVLKALVNLYFAEVKARNRKPVYNDDLEEQMNKVADWMVNPQTHPWLWLCGQCGNGKSTMLKAIQSVYTLFPLTDPNDHRRMGFVIKEAKDIVETGRKDDREFCRIKNLPMLAIDDLGTEPREVQEFGNILTPMTDLLQHRYDESTLTVISTNLTREQVAHFYGQRITDRFNEMVEKVIFPNGSYRCV